MKKHSEKQISQKLVDKWMAKKFSGTVFAHWTPGCTYGTRMRFTDAEHGDFYTTMQNIVQKSHRGHPIRSMEARKRPHLSHDAVSKMVHDATCGKVLLVTQYQSMLKKAMFIDVDYGEFRAWVANVAHKGTRHPDAAPDRRRETFIRKHGVDHYLKNPDEYRRVQRQVRGKKICYNWHDGSEIRCDSEWERITVEWLNARKERFEWHPRSFAMPNGNTYWPDAYLIDRDLWVEVKGRRFPSAMEKWEWFHAEHPNSELWDKQKLKSIGIL